MAEVRTSGARSTGLTLSGNIGRLGLGFVASVMIARSLGPAAYGLIALVSVVFAVVDAVGDFGLTYTAVRAISRHLGADPDRARWLAHGYLSLGLIANSAAALAGILLAEPIARLALGQPEAEPYIRLALLGLVSVTGSGFATALLQSTHRFGKLAALQVLTACSYLVGILALAAFGHLDVTSIVLLGVVNPLVGFVVGLRLLPPNVVSLRQLWARPARRAWSELAAFSKWLWLSSILSLLVSQLDLLLLAQWVSAPMVGVYALAFNLASKLDIVNQTRLTVLLPAVSALRDDKEIRRYVRRNLARSVPLAAGLALTVPLARPFIATFYGPAYEEALLPLVVLIAVAIFGLVCSPLFLLGFALDQPRAFAGSDVVRVLTLVGAGLLLIPTLGPVGAALARLASRVAGAAFMLAAITFRLRATGGPTPQVPAASSS